MFENLTVDTLKFLKVRNNWKFERLQLWVVGIMKYWNSNIWILTIWKYEHADLDSKIPNFSF